MDSLSLFFLFGLEYVALTSYIRRERPQQFSPWRHALVPWTGTLALVPVFFVTVYPVPDWPYNITPYLFALLMVTGIGYLQWLRSHDPSALRQGATMLVGTPLDEAGDVDWDKAAIETE